MGFVLASITRFTTLFYYHYNYRCRIRALIIFSFATIYAFLNLVIVVIEKGFRVSLMFGFASIRVPYQLLKPEGRSIQEYSLCQALFYKRFLRELCPNFSLTSCFLYVLERNRYSDTSKINAITPSIPVDGYQVSTLEVKAGEAGKSTNPCNAERTTAALAALFGQCATQTDGAPSQLGPIVNESC